jgi:murein DD-endopeptidase MepM/ murein hydrolase activator NlpD
MKIAISFMLAMAATAALAADASQIRSFYHPYDSAGSQKTVSYTVKTGETLFDIAEKLLGDPYQASALAKRNKIRDPLHLEAGMVIQVPAPRLSLRYSMQKLVKSSSGFDVEPVRDGAKLAAGDRFQLWLAANCDGYLYIFNRDAKGDVQRVFPASDRKTARVRRFSEYLVPRNGWFRMDAAKGDEELLVLVSLEPLSDLEGDLIANGVVQSYFDGKKAGQGKGITIDAPEEGEGSVVVEGPIEGGIVLAHTIHIGRSAR